MEEHQKEELVTALHKTLSNLHTIWEDIGIDSAEKKERTAKYVKYVQDTLKKIVEGEVEMKNGIIKSVKKNYKEYSQLCRELEIEESVEDVDDVSLIELDQNLKTKLSELLVEVKNRQETMEQLRSHEQELCERMIEDPATDVPNIPTMKDIKDMEDRIKTLNLEMKYREQTFINLKEKLTVMYEELDEAPISGFEREIFSGIEDLFTLSQQNMKRLKQLSATLEMKIENNEREAVELEEKVEKLWKRLDIEVDQIERFKLDVPIKIATKIKKLKVELQRLEDIKVQNLACYINRTKGELEEYWEKCYVSEEERNNFMPYFQDTCNEEVLNLCENEVERFKQYYKKAEKLFIRLEKRQNLWNKFMELDSNINDPSRLFGNRGCSLLQEEKQRKRINNELPKIENELEKLSEVWEEDNDQKFTVNGMNVLDYFKNQWEIYTDSKQKEKINRKIAKANELEYESRLGSTPRGAKRKIAARNETLRSSKHLKLSDSVRTPSSILSSTRSNSTKSSFMSSTLINNEFPGTPKFHPIRGVLKEQNINTPKNKGISFLKKDSSFTISKTPSRITRLNTSKTPHIPHPSPRRKISSVTPFHKAPPKALPRTAPAHMRRRSARINKNSLLLSPITPSTTRTWNSNMNKTKTPSKMARNKLSFLM